MFNITLLLKKEGNMLRKVLALSAVVIFVLGIGCSNGQGPTTPTKGSQADIEAYFNSFDLSNPVVGEFTITGFDGNVISTGKLARQDGQIVIVDERGAQVDVDLTPLNLMICFVTYNNPAGTISTGPNAGLPYYYINQTVDYDIGILSLLNQQIGQLNPPFGYTGPAELTAEMHYAAFGVNNEIIAGPIMPGAPTFNWSGIISPGYQSLNDLYFIPNGTLPGLDVTTVRVQAPIFFGMLDLIFYDGVAGVWDPQ
jgi:hypothetical protein